MPADRIVVVHDGPDYQRYGAIVAFSEQVIKAGHVRPYHLALISSDDRLEDYSANPVYARALAEKFLPELFERLGTDKPVLGVGASLGALAMLHAQRRHPARFAGLLLQSGSFFQPRFDRQESGFARWLRIVRFTGRVIRSTGGPGVPIALTCGTVEENLANNRDMAAVLAGQGYAVEFAEVRGGHDWESWRAAFDPHFTDLLKKVFR